MCDHVLYLPDPNVAGPGKQVPFRVDRCSGWLRDILVFMMPQRIRLNLQLPTFQKDAVRVVVQPRLEAFERALER
jgi:hypothetical protein